MSHVGAKGVRHEVYSAVCVFTDELGDFCGDISCLLFDHPRRKGVRLILQVEEVQVEASFPIDKFLELLRVLKEAVRDGLELLDVALIAHNKEVHQLLRAFGLVVTLARVVDLVNLVRVWVNPIQIVLSLHVDVCE